MYAMAVLNISIFDSFFSLGWAGRRPRTLANALLNDSTRILKQGKLLRYIGYMVVLSVIMLSAAGRNFVRILLLQKKLFEIKKFCIIFSH